MIRRALLALGCAMFMILCVNVSDADAQQRAYGRVWGGQYNQADWERFYHYPYVFYPQNFWGNEYYRSSESLYYRYPPEMRIPVYNKHWHNYYPPQSLGKLGHKRYIDPRRYHSGHHFILDIF